MSEIGKRIKELRVKHNMTQAELGELLGVQKSAIQKYESGAIVNLRSDKIKILSKTFHTLPRYFVFENEDEFWSSVFGEKDPFISDLGQTVLKKLENYYGMAMVKVINSVNSLNNVGQVKVHDYISDLLKIEEYLSDKREGGE